MCDLGMKLNRLQMYDGLESRLKVWWGGFLERLREKVMQMKGGVGFNKPTRTAVLPRHACRG